MTAIYQAPRSGSIRWGRFFLTRWITHALRGGSWWCQRCRTPWRFVEGHTTYYTDHSGCFPLCERCWAELTPEERLPHYRWLWDYWQSPAAGCLELMEPEDWPEVWEKIREAVLAGG